MHFSKTLFLAFLALAIGPASTQAHPLNATQIQISFDSSSQFKAQVYLDFTREFGSPDAYYAFSLLAPAAQEKKIRELSAPVVNELQFAFGDQPVKMELTGWKVPTASRQIYNDYYIGKMTCLDLVGTIPPNRPPFTLRPTDQISLEFPVAVIVERPDRQIDVVDWIAMVGDTCDPINYDGETASKIMPSTTPGADGLSGANLAPSQRFWEVKLGTIARYLGLGFRHIVPEGTDHILFVLGLFFLARIFHPLVKLIYRTVF
jgi:hypothetical protein